MSCLANAFLATTMLPGQAPAIRDSAQIHIVESPSLPDAGRASRQLANVPTLSLGTGPGEQFGGVSAAVRLSDGRIVVADSRDNELRLYTAVGGLVRTIGRRGEGPGDFRRISAAARLAGDTIVAWDAILRRLTYFNASGAVARSTMVGRPPVHTTGGHESGFTLDFAGRLSDGTALVYDMSQHFNPGTNWFKDSLFLYEVARNGELMPSRNLFRGDVFTYEFRSARGRAMGSDLRPFTARGSVAVGARAYWYTDGRTYELREYSRRGVLLRILRLRRTPPPVTASDIASYASSIMKDAEGARNRPLAEEAARWLVKWMTFPKSHAAFDALLVSGDGTVWARVSGDSTRAQEWISFDAAGRASGSLTVPAQLQVLEIAPEYVLGTFRDIEGVESVRVYRYLH